MNITPAGVGALAVTVTLTAAGQGDTACPSATDSSHE